MLTYSVGILVIIVLIFIYLLDDLHILYINIGLTYLHDYMTLSLNKSPKFSNVVFLLSHDHGILPEYAQQSIEIITQYCLSHNYKLEIRNHCPNDTISPYWLRVVDLIDLSKKYDENTMFIYMDLDATVNPKYFDLRIEDLIHAIDIYDNKTYDIYIGRDNSFIRRANTGVIFLRNTVFTKKLLEYWLKQYKRNKWYKVNGKWICEINEKKCKWTRDGYEQEELNKIYNNNIMNDKRIKMLHTSICSNFSISHDCFIYHLMSKRNKNKMSIIYSRLNQ